MKTRHFLRAVAVAAALTTLAPVVAQAQAKEPVKASLRLKWLPQAQFAGYYYAQAKGYYKAEGIDLTINPGGPNLLAENLVSTGADTFGVSGGSDSVLAAVDKGMPVVAFGVGHQLTPYRLVTRGDGPIKTLKDFEGKTVTTWFIGSQLVLKNMLTSAGVDVSKVNIQPQQVTMTPFINGDVDVASATYYNETYVLRQKMGDNLRFFRAEDFGISSPADTLITARKTAKEKPELVKAFLRASIKGWEAALANPKEAIDIILKVAPTLNREQQEFMLVEAGKLMREGKAKTEGLYHIDYDVMNKAQKALLEGKFIKSPVDVKVAFDDSFLKAVRAGK